MTATDKPPSKPFKEQLQDALPKGLVESEGWRRLSGAAGLIFAAPVLVVCLFAILRDPWWSTPYFAAQQISGAGVALKVVVGATATIVAFTLPWGILQLIGWIVEGFKPPENPN